MARASDLIVNGVDPNGTAALSRKTRVRCASTGDLPACTLVGSVLTADANGAMPAWDGVAPEIGNRLFHLGATAPNAHLRLIWIADDLGGLASKWRMHIAQDVSTGTTLLPASDLVIAEGATLADREYELTTDTIPIVPGTTPLAWQQQAGPGLYTASDGVALVGVDFRADATVVRTSGAQNIAGVKTFTDSPIVEDDLTFTAAPGGHTVAPVAPDPGAPASPMTFRSGVGADASDAGAGSAATASGAATFKSARGGHGTAIRPAEASGDAAYGSGNAGNNGGGGGAGTGNATLDTGTPTGAGVAGQARVGSTNAESVLIGRAGKVTTLAGNTVLGSYEEIAEMAAPAAPAANTVRLFVRTNGIASPGHRSQLCMIDHGNNILVIAETGAD